MFGGKIESALYSIFCDRVEVEIGKLAPSLQVPVAKNSCIEHRI